jgi:outer membrane protein assembly factor BamB
MTEDNDTISQHPIQLPRHLFLFCLFIAELMPFIARLPSVPFVGWEWFTAYFPGIGSLLFFSAVNLIPGGVLYGLGKGSKRCPLAFWFALAAGIGFLLFAHGTINLHSSSTAALGLVFIPIYGVAAVVVGWGIGLFVDVAVKAERIRKYLTWIAGIIAILFGVGNAVYESRTASVREARFPVISINELPLSKRVVYSSPLQRRVEALSLGNFDKDLGSEIAVLCDSETILLNSLNYSIKTKSEFKLDKCDDCVHMYPYLVPDGTGNLLVVSSDGVADSRGHLLWQLRANGFARLVPIQTPTGTPAFFAYINDRMDCHDIDGKVLWSAKLGVSGVSTYVTSDGERLPVAQTGYAKSQEINLYGLDGKLRKTIKIPEWGSYVEEVAWPSQGHLLVGAGSSMGVLDSNGKEVFRYFIKDTSFSPYHGPEGTAVRLNPSEPPYLAVMSHGSSGYPRSVLLIFDSKGHLVWQEETKKLTSILSVPQPDGNGEKLLVGGMDGIIEYSLSKPKEPNNGRQKDSVPPLSTAPLRP